uniref:Adhesion molecule immunoglobulin-like domain-containing protein n=1 Tax=Bos indicus x Bos taurus TaxID=30522 RepID=A0A4W2EVD2_BOBOX
MAVGESRNFTCRMTCADGRAASVVWRGLDTSLGAVQSSAGLSILYVLNASLSAAGTRVCVGSCGDVNLQHRVRLLLFGEPPPLPPPLRPRGPGRQPCFPSVPWPPPPGTLPGLPTTSQLLARLAGPPESLCSPRSPRIPLPNPRPILQDLTPCPFRSGLALTPYTLATQAVVAGLACPGAPAVSRNPRPHLHATSSRRSPKPPGSAHPLLPSPTAFPDQLTVSPEAVVPGRDQEVACTAHNVTPPGPDTLSMSLLLGDRELEGVEALPNVTEEPQEGEDSLFQVTQRWLLPTSETSSLRTLHCQVTMRLPGRELTHHRTIPVLQGLTSPEPPSITSSELPTMTPAKPSITASPEPTDTTTPESFVMKPPKPPITTSPELASTYSPASPGPASPGATSSNSSTRPCLPEIHQSSASGALELLCEVPCGPSMAVRWTQAPGGLEAYETWEAGAQAWLSSRSTLWSGCHPEGWFQCRLDPGGHMANLYVVPEICSPTMSAALWTSSLALGLLLLVFLAYHLWKRCQPTSR